mmetsp:Transcript_18137/g.42389  ORF Transcript_18137/g.42389 Transcript_18137/m.42389 type:complete len:383 (+) Transcript_18137:68-1216(+)|eukprot:CAMPEP_0178446868 /NCGR_PEP_ID=MMETSP0689_2-20121128/41062_1 /TAXON_ID=160604 /ORGANISM="Amphidinium massartii, Strain CS-259" /LENGTH=382 /DNA_ID=CAMNT_0020071779 /DNA_START=60 /DNA_END=1208 /DNA_ORIENTATION=-
MGQTAALQVGASLPFASTQPEAEEEDDYEVDGLVNASIERIHSMVCTPHAFEPHQHPPPMRLKDVYGRDMRCTSLPPQAVILNVYDLSEDFLDANDMLSFGFEDMRLGGAFHAGVELLGSEWAYGFCGVMCMAPRIAADHVYRCGVLLGTTSLSPIQIAMVLQELCNTWRGGDYDLIGKNCCSFSTALLQKLGVGTMPAWVDRLARLLNQGRSAGEGAVQVGRDAGQVLLGRLSSKSQNGVNAVAGSHKSMSMAQGKQADINWDLWEGTIMEYPVGSEVEYKSASTGKWITTKVKSANKGAGTYDLECKQQVAPSSIRWPGGRKPVTRPTGGAELAIGTSVEYLSTSQGIWVPAKIMAYDASTGLYDLDCKKQVPRARIRAT